MSHRPYASMKNKIGVAISTTAGVGAKRVTKSITQQMFWWGVSKTYRPSFAVSATSWSEVKNDKKSKITNDVKKTAKKIKKSIGNVKPSIKSKFIFNIMKAQQKGMSWNPVDRKHWEDNNWI